MKTDIKHPYMLDTYDVAGETLSRGKYTMCPMCHNVKYKKQWHAAGSKVALLAHGRRAHTEVRRCPACEMKLEGLYNAVVIIHNVPKHLAYTIESLITNEAKNATYHNPQNRVLEIIELVDGYEVHTTTPKVARAISDKLKSVFSKSEVVSYVQVQPFRHHIIDVCIPNTAKRTKHHDTPSIAG